MPILADFAVADDDTQKTVTAAGVDASFQAAAFTGGIDNGAAVLQFKLDTAKPLNNAKLQVSILRGAAEVVELTATFNTDTYITLHESLTIDAVTNPVTTITGVRYKQVSGTGTLKVSDTFILFQKFIPEPPENGG